MYFFYQNISNINIPYHVSLMLFTLFFSPSAHVSKRLGLEEESGH